MTFLSFEPFMRLASAIAAAAVAALLSFNPAIADTYRFNVSDPAATLGGQPFKNYFFFIDSSMAPASYDTNTFSYNVVDFGQTFSPDEVMDTVTFYDSNDLGGLSNNFTTTFEPGPQAFGGATSAPTFQDALYRYDTNEPNGGETLQINDISATPVSAAPEPSTWTLMFGGIAAIGLMLRRRRSVALGVAACGGEFTIANVPENEPWVGSCPREWCSSTVAEPLVKRAFHMAP